MKLINYGTFTCFTYCHNYGHMFCDVNVFDVKRTSKNKMVISFSFKDFMHLFSSPKGSENNSAENL